MEPAASTLVVEQAMHRAIDANRAFLRLTLTCAKTTAQAAHDSVQRREDWVMSVFARHLLHYRDLRVERHIEHGATAVTATATFVAEFSDLAACEACYAEFSGKLAGILILEQPRFTCTPDVIDATRAELVVAATRQLLTKAAHVARAAQLHTVRPRLIEELPEAGGGSASGDRKYAPATGVLVSCAVRGTFDVVPRLV